MFDDYFLEVPIYRSSHIAHLNEHERISRPRIEAYMSQGDDETTARIRAEPFEGNPWPYNLAIGWLRLVAQTHTVKGYLWWTSAKRITRRSSAARHYEPWDKVLEHGFRHNATNEEIVTELRDAIRGVCSAYPAKGRHADLTALDNIAEFVDWRRLLWIGPGRG